MKSEDRSVCVCGCGVCVYGGGGGGVACLVSFDPSTTEPLDPAS